MIKNFWKSIELYCQHRHEKPVKMELIQGPHSLFYACPKYYPENRESGEQACNNRLNLVDFEVILDHLSNLVEESEANGERLNLSHYKWKYKSIEIEVMEHNDNKVKVLILNRKAIK